MLPVAPVERPSWFPGSRDSIVSLSSVCQMFARGEARGEREGYLIHSMQAAFFNI